MTNELALKVAALKVFSDYAKTAYDKSREEIGRQMGRGDRLQVRSPLDESLKIGPISKSDPKPTARVEDLRVLTDWFIQNHPDLTGTGYEVAGTQTEVVAVLFEHAPHLLRRVREIKPDALSELRKASAALGQPIGPGGEADVPGLVVETPDPVVSCKPDPDMALPAVVELFRAGRLDLDATLRPALES